MSTSVPRSSKPTAPRAQPISYAAIGNSGYPAALALQEPHILDPSVIDEVERSGFIAALDR